MKKAQHKVQSIARNKPTVSKPMRVYGGIFADGIQALRVECACGNRFVVSAASPDTECKACGNKRETQYLSYGSPRVHGLDEAKN